MESKTIGNKAGVLVIIGMLALFGYAAKYAGTVPIHTAKNATWTITIPKSCYGQALVWTKGNFAMKNVPVSEFIKLRDEFESCGGSIKIANEDQ